MNINDYLIILKELNKLLNNLQYLIDPNITEDIISTLDAIKTIKEHILFLTMKHKKRNHFLKKNKRNKKIIS